MSIHRDNNRYLILNTHTVHGSSTSYFIVKSLHHILTCTRECVPDLPFFIGQEVGNFRKLGDNISEPDRLILVYKWL